MIGGSETCDSRTRAQDSGVLAYATPGKRVEWVPPPLWLRFAVIALALLVLALFLLGLPPLAGALDYTRSIPLTEAIDYAWNVGIRQTLQERGMMRLAVFAPTALVGLSMFLCLRGARAQRITFAANIFLPALWLWGWWPIFIALGPLALVGALTGQADGETWSEGFVSYGAVASWTTLWLTVMLVLRVSNKKRAKSNA